MENPIREVYDFPTQIPLKVIGRNQDEFEKFVVETLLLLVDETEFFGAVSRSSRANAYLSVTVTFTARSREHLDAIYQTFTRHERVLMVI